MADSVETLGVDLRTRVEELHEGGYHEVITSGCGASKNLESSCSGDSSNGWLFFRIFKVEIGATEWTFERIREAFEKVTKDEVGSLNIEQGIMLKRTDFLRRVIAPAGGQGGVTMSYLCPNCNSFLL